MRDTAAARVIPVFRHTAVSASLSSSTLLYSLYQTASDMYHSVILDMFCSI
jgi:hypothetical protein